MNTLPNLCFVSGASNPKRYIYIFVCEVDLLLSFTILFAAITVYKRPVRGKDFLLQHFVFHIFKTSRRLACRRICIYHLPYRQLQSNNSGAAGV